MTMADLPTGVPAVSHLRGPSWFIDPEYSDISLVISVP